jgi:hypothetical protein
MRLTLGLLILAGVSVLARSGDPGARPRSLLIHGEPWPIVQAVKLGHGITGRTVCNAHLILVRPGESEQDFADTVLHEAQHAFTCEDGRIHNKKFNNDDDTGSHDGIYWATGEWKHFITDNPQFIEFVQKSNRPAGASAGTPASGH